jgi:hypothetical protein
MFQRACLFSLLLYSAIAGFYWYFLRHSLPIAGAIGLSLFLALFAVAGIGTIRTSFQARKNDRLFKEAEGGALLQDGKKVMVAGSLHPQGFPIQTPFTQEECVLYEYDIKQNNGSDGENARSEFTGIKMVPCSIHSNRGNVRLIGFPHPDHIEARIARGPEAQENARRFVQSAQFEQGSLLSVGKMISGLIDAWRDEDGAVQKDWRLSKDANFKEGSVLRERYVSPGESVVAIGIYSATQNGLIAPKDDSIDLIPGDLNSARETVAQKGNLVTGIVFFLAAQLFFGLFYLLTEKGISLSSPEQQSTKLHAAVSNGDYKELARLKRNNVSFDLKDSAGKTPLMVTQDITMATYLLQNGANVDVVDQETGETAIFNAARIGNEELLRLYIKHGADVQHISNVPWEHMPIHTAIESGQPECATILRENGAHDDRVNSITGKALAYAGGPQFEVIEKYHAAIQDQNIEELKNLTTSRQANFFETVDFNTWKYYYQPDMQLIEGYYNDSAATIKIQVITPDNYSVRWVYQLVRRGDDWKIARVWEVREP